MVALGSSSLIERDGLIQRTQDLFARRSSREPDYRSENQALRALAQQLADHPAAVQQRLVELVVDLCRAGSAGISILSQGETVFKWAAIAGDFKHHLGGTLPRSESPCGIVVDLDDCLYFEDVHNTFPAAAALQPRIVEVILAPFHVGDRAVGTIWALCHDPARRFDAEDMRLLTSMASFASLRIFASESAMFAPSIRADAARAALASLTVRQRDILRRILTGQPNKNIAADLGISQRTAENHRAAIMRKMQVSSISALVQVALVGADVKLSVGESERSFQA